MASFPPHLAQAAIHVRDIARARAFYGGQLGSTHLFDAPPTLVEPARQIAEGEGKEIHLAILGDGEGNVFGLISG